MTTEPRNTLAGQDVPRSDGIAARPPSEQFLDRLIETSARNKFLVLLLTVVALFGAGWAIHNIPLDAIPDLSDTQVIIFSRWDRSPE